MSKTNEKGGAMMPERDTTGPMGLGSMTGKRLGSCKTVETRTAIFGCGFGRGVRRIHRAYTPNAETLATEKALLEKRIAEIDESLKK